jgi:hypothetical protein
VRNGCAAESVAYVRTSDTFVLLRMMPDVPTKRAKIARDESNEHHIPVA